MENSDGQTDKWDALLGKYVSVWVWSVLMGIATSVAISFTSVRATRGVFGLVLAFPVVLGVSATSMSLVQLLRYLRRHIIPTFLQNSDHSDGRPSPDSMPPAYHLYGALRYVIYAILLRVIAAVLEIGFNSLAFLG